MSAREEILGRVRAALADVDRDLDRATELPPAPRVSPAADLVGHFAARVEHYRAVVERCSAADLEDVVAAALPSGATVVVPPGLSFEVAGAVVDPEEDGALSALELDRVDAVVTQAAVGIAETGTLVLDHGPGQGRRAITLIPDLHICVIRADQIVPDVPDALDRLDPARPSTWISGPSATSDIELDRVEGVHGPRALHVMIVQFDALDPSLLEAEGGGVAT
ncbi:MAG: lactate utilization protein C [Actinomycetota bacterium]|nr:lactate utilization protein C [Actinomycetota bacterium]